MEGINSSIPWRNVPEDETRAKRNASRAQWILNLGRSHATGIPLAVPNHFATLKVGLDDKNNQKK